MDALVFPCAPTPDFGPSTASTQFVIQINNISCFYFDSNLDMVRPKASKISCEIASTFAMIVTVETENKDDLLARIGPYSIYAVFSRLVPKANIC